MQVQICGPPFRGIKRDQIVSFTPSTTPLHLQGCQDPSSSKSSHIQSLEIKQLQLQGFCFLGRCVQIWQRRYPVREIEGRGNEQVFSQTATPELFAIGGGLGSHMLDSLKQYNCLSLRCKIRNPDFPFDTGIPSQHSMYRKRVQVMQLDGAI